MMIDFLFAMLAAGINGASDGSAQDRPSAVTQAPAAAGVTASVPVLPVPTPPAAPNGFNMAVVPAGLSAEPQAPLGKFTTATEIKPILEATKTNWVAVRQYDGKDLLYITHLWSWRCGLAAIAVSVNGEAMQNWPMPPCHTDLSTPNAIQEGDGFPYLSLREGAVQTITVQIVYDDLSMDVASFDRGAVLIP
tara:strand:- start:46 stop:621 length:576 start_codon:yes stop_codon:yes gene_type:complete